MAGFGEEISRDLEKPMRHARYGWELGFESEPALPIVAKNDSGISEDRGCRRRFGKGISTPFLAKSRWCESTQSGLRF